MEYADAVIVRADDPRPKVLLIKRTDNGQWALPGGGIDPGETALDAVLREVREELGISLGTGTPRLALGTFNLGDDEFSEGEATTHPFLFLVEEIKQEIKPQAEEVSAWKWVALNVAGVKIWDAQKRLLQMANLAMRFGTKAQPEDQISVLFTQLLKDQHDEEVISKASRFAANALRGKKNRERLASLGPIGAVKEVVSRAVPKKTAEPVATDQAQAYIQLKKKFQSQQLIKGLKSFIRYGKALMQLHNTPAIMRGLSLSVEQIHQLSKALWTQRSSLLTPNERDAQILVHENEDKNFASLVSSFGNLYQRVTSNRRIGAGIEPLPVLIQKVSQLGDEGSVEQRAQLYMHIEELWNTATILDDYIKKLEAVKEVSEDRSYNSFLLDLELI